MNFNLLDTPPIRSILFYPRAATPLSQRQGHIVDGEIPVDENVAVGYRLYCHARSEAPLLLFFHGNGEIAADYDMISRHFLDIGLSMLVIDFRGYGWSGGQPRVKHLINDVEPILQAVPAIQSAHGLDAKRLLAMGRSLGSISAIHAAYQFPSALAGLIVESGFAQLPPLLARLGLPVQWQANLPDPIGNLRKMTEIEVPLLIIHGERDSLIPVANAQQLYEASPATHKRIARLAGVGHNDLLLKRDAYFEAIRTFLPLIMQ